MMFRLVIYGTTSENKYDSEHRHELLGDRKSIWHAWYSFARGLGFKHVEVFNLGGEKQTPEKGIDTLEEFIL